MFAPYPEKRTRHSHACSTLVLCLAAVAALTSVAATAIAFATDNWQTITVDRNALAVSAANTSALSGTDLRYYSRVRGLFRTCFPHRFQRPGDLEGMYLSPVEEWCVNVDYYFKLLDYSLTPPEKFSEYAVNWFHISRATIAGFILFFMWMTISFVTGLCGCWRADGDHLVSTAMLMLLAAISGAVAMGCWHWAQFYEMYKVFDSELSFFNTWPPYLKSTTHFNLGWSYALAWIGIALALVASILFTASALCLRTVLREQEHQDMLVKMQLTYPTLQNTLMRQQHHGSMSMLPVNINHTLPRGGGSSASSTTGSIIASDRLSLAGGFPGAAPSANYYPAGYPVHYDDGRSTAQYKSVVKELEDAKL